MKKDTFKIWKRTSLVAVICFVLILILYFTGIFTFLENKTYDSRMGHAASYIHPNQDIVLVAVTQESIDWALEKYGWSWPWPRESSARIVDYVSAGGAKSFGFDMIYNEPSFYGEEDDLAFGKSEKESGIVIQTMFVSQMGNTETVVFPTEIIGENAAMLANITSAMDSDDVIRRSRLNYVYDGKVYASLGIAPVVLTEGKVSKKIPVLKDGTVLLRFQKSIDDYSIIPAHEILENYDLWKAGDEEYNPEAYFSDAYVYYALYAPGLFDICSIPQNQVYPGVGVHITLLDNYLSDNFMRKLPLAVNILWLAFLCFAGAFAVTLGERFKSLSKIVIVMTINFLVLIFIAWELPYILFIFGFWINLVAPLAGLCISFVISLALSFMIEGKQKRFIKSAFSQCLSKEVVNLIVSNPDSFKLGGDKFHMSAIFTDIRKFSSFSELMTASELGELLNFYLTRMSEIIINEGGTVDKYEGDAIVAMVGAPYSMEDHAKRACRAAIKMKKAEVLMNKEIVETAAYQRLGDTSEDLYSAFKIMVANNKTLFTRIGINSGEMIAGYFGSENKKNYTMFGNNVNLASRLEGVNKHYSTGGILISEATRNLLDDDFVVRSLDRVRVVNVNTPIRLYELIEEKKSASKALLDYVSAWEAALKLFEEENYAAALKEFTSLKDSSEFGKSDNVALYYIDLIEKYFIKGTFPTESDDAGVAYNRNDKVFKLLQK